MRSEFSQKQKQIHSALSKSPGKKLEKVQSDGELITGADQSSASAAISINVNEEDF